jgi:hypothetical protein
MRSLSSKDVPTREPLPQSIDEIKDHVLRQKISDAWHACRYIFRAIDVWREWVLEWEATGNADPGVPMRLWGGCGTAARTLADLGLKIRGLQGDYFKQIMDSLPSVPLALDAVVAARALLDVRAGRVPKLIDLRAGRVPKLMKPRPWFQDADSLVLCQHKLAELASFQGHLAESQSLLESSPSMCLLERSPSAVVPDAKPDTPKKFSHPTDTLVANLCQRLKRRPVGVRIIDVCREIDPKRAESLARQARKYRHLWQA